MVVIYPDSALFYVNLLFFLFCEIENMFLKNNDKKINIDTSGGGEYTESIDI